MTLYETDEKCRKCENNGTTICNRCDMYYDEFDPIDESKQTNYDRIRAMRIEELAEWIETIANCDSCHHSWSFGKCRGGDGTTHAACRLKWLDWLKQEAV